MMYFFDTHRSYLGKYGLILRFSRRTAAVIKNCVCGRPIVKSDGCNKVRCYCGRTICDYCGEDVTNSGYNHYAGEGGIQHRVGRKCPLYDDNTKRNDKNAKAAEERAKKKIREENPDLSEADLEIKFKKDVQSSPWRRHIALPPLPPRVPAAPLHHDFPRFPGYGPPIVGPPVYPQNAPHGRNMIEPMHHPYIPAPFPGLGPPIVGHFGERPRHGAAVPPHRIPEGNHHGRPQDADRRAAPHDRRHAVRAGEGYGAPDRVDQRLNGDPTNTRHTRGERQATTGKLEIPKYVRRERG